MRSQREAGKGTAAWGEARGHDGGEEGRWQGWVGACAHRE